MTEQPRTGALRYGPRPAVFVGCAVLAVGATLAAFFGRSTIDRLVAVVVLVLVLATMLAALRMRDRLRATTTGLVVGSLAGQRAIAWSQVRRMEVVERRRLGTTSTSLEIDLDDDELLIFGRTDLGADPSDVADQLTALRTGR